MLEPTPTKSLHVYGVTRFGGYPTGYTHRDDSDRRSLFGVVAYTQPVDPIDVRMHELLELDVVSAATKTYTQSQIDKSLSEIIEWAKNTSVLEVPVEFLHDTNGTIVAFPIFDKYTTANEPMLWAGSELTGPDEELVMWPQLAGKIQHLPIEGDLRGRRYWSVSGHDGIQRPRDFSGASTISRADRLMFGMHAMLRNELSDLGDQLVASAFRVSQALIDLVWDKPQHPLHKFFVLGNRGRRLERRDSFNQHIVPFALAFVDGAKSAIKSRLKEVMIGGPISRVVTCTEEAADDSSRRGNAEAGFRGDHPVFLRFIYEKLLPEKGFIAGLDLDDPTASAIDKLFKTQKPYIAKLYEEEKLLQEGLLAADVNSDTYNPNPDVPQVPNLSPNTELFPHQASAAAAIKGMENAILDVDVGGGKTILAVIDMLHHMNSGTIKRPAFVMPNRLIAQQRREILKFTDQRLNVIIVNSDTVSFVDSNKVSVREAPEDATKAELDAFELTYDYDDIELRMNPKSPRVIEATKMVTEAPPNTVYLVSYEWLRRYQDKLPAGEGNRTIAVSWASEWLSSCGIDYTFFDESHWLSKKSSTHAKAARSLAQNCKIRRLATGTTMPNSPEDLYFQISIIAPGFFGSLEKFQEDYCGFRGYNGRTRKFKPDAAKRIRKVLRENLGVCIRRDNWRHLLPKRIQKIHYAQLPPKQQIIYETIRDANIEYVLNDPALKKAYESLQAEADEEGLDAEEGPLFQKLLGRIGRIDMAVNSPWTDPGLGGMLDVLAQRGVKLDVEVSDEEKEDIKKAGADPDKMSKKGEAAAKRVSDAVERFLHDERKSAKTDILDTLIDEHLAKFPDAKIIVMGTNNRSVEGVRAFSKYRAFSEFYSAKFPEALVKFERDPHVKVLFAVDGSLKEGRNLQFSNCIIRVDLPWGPGDLEQAFGRVFRFGQKKEVYIHMILAEHTSDMARFARLVAKRQQQSKTNSDYDDGTEAFVFNMNPDTMTLMSTRDSVIQMEDEDGNIVESSFQNALDVFHGIDIAEIERNNAIQGKIGEKHYPVSNGKMISGSRDAGVTQVLKDDRARARADKRDWQQRAGSEASAGFGALKNAEFGGLPVEALTPEARELAEKASFNVQLVLWNHEPDGDPDVFLAVPISEPNSASLRGVKFRRSERAYAKQIKTSGDAENILRRVLSLLGGRYPDDLKKYLGVEDARELIKAVRSYLTKGKAERIEFPDPTDEEIEAVPNRIEGFSLAFFGKKAFFYVEEEEGGASLSILTAAGFKPKKSMYWRGPIHPVRTKLQQVINDIYKRGLRIANFKELQAEVKVTFKLKLKEPKSSTPALEEETPEEKAAKKASKWDKLLQEVEKGGKGKGKIKLEDLTEEEDEELDEDDEDEVEESKPAKKGGKKAPVEEDEDEDEDEEDDEEPAKKGKKAPSMSDLQKQIELLTKQLKQQKTISQLRKAKKKKP